MKLLVLELGTGLPPLLLDFAKYQGLLTQYWLKSLWEKLSLFDFRMTIHNLELDMPFVTCPLK